MFCAAACLDRSGGIKAVRKQLSRATRSGTRTHSHTRTTTKRTRRPPPAGAQPRRRRLIYPQTPPPPPPRARRRLLAPIALTYETPRGCVHLPFTSAHTHARSQTVDQNQARRGAMARAAGLQPPPHHNRCATKKPAHAHAMASHGSRGSGPPASVKGRYAGVEGKRIPLIIGRARTRPRRAAAPLRARRQTGRDAAIKSCRTWCPCQNTH